MLAGIPMPNIRVLLVEDDPNDAELLLRQLSRAEFEVEHFYTLGGGLNRLASGGIDAIVMDLNFPESVRHETLARVNLAAKEVPVIVVSGQDDERIRAAALQSGVKHYFVKGRVKADALKDAILHEAQVRRAATEQT